MWLNVLKFFCWLGWHLWEYIWKGGGVEAHVVSHRKCKRCGTTEKYSVASGGWHRD
jgi:hypothetical protein